MPENDGGNDDGSPDVLQGSPSKKPNHRHKRINMHWNYFEPVPP
jgi:hypothetical protein